MELSVLQTALLPRVGAERFLPPQIYIREEMEQVAKEILANGSTTTLTVFSGSPWHRKVHCFFPSDLVPGLEPFS